MSNVGYNLRELEGSSIWGSNVINPFDKEEQRKHVPTLDVLLENDGETDDDCIYACGVVMYVCVCLYVYTYMHW